MSEQIVLYGGPLDGTEYVLAQPLQHLVLLGPPPPLTWRLADLESGQVEVVDLPRLVYTRQYVHSTGGGRLLVRNLRDQVVYRHTGTQV